MKNVKTAFRILEDGTYAPYDHQFVSSSCHDGDLYSQGPDRSWGAYDALNTLHVASAPPWRKNCWQEWSRDFLAQSAEGYILVGRLSRQERPMTARRRPRGGGISHCNRGYLPYCGDLILDTHHHEVAAATEVSGVAEFFGEEVAGIDDTGNVFDLDKAELMGFTYVVLFEIHVFGALFVTEAAHWTHASLSLYTVILSLASDMGRWRARLRMCSSPVMHWFVATISASQELRDVLFCLMDFQLIGPPERQITNPEML
eukprot:scaffold10518_cov43-Cyclotella_meneghiniana.AAC.3